MNLIAIDFANLWNAIRSSLNTDNKKPIYWQELGKVIQRVIQVTTQQYYAEGLKFKI